MKDEPNDKVLILAGPIEIVNKWRMDAGLTTDDFNAKYLIAYDIDSVRGRRFSGFIKLPNWYSLRGIEKIIEYLDCWQVPEVTLGMQLGAYIDQNGNAFIGKIENTEWLHFDLPEKYTRILNEKGGEVVSAQEIAFAISEHDPRGTSEHFDSGGTMEFYLHSAD